MSDVIHSKHSGIIVYIFLQKLLNKPLATFKLVPLAVFSKKHGYKQLLSQDDVKENNIEEQMDIVEAEEINNT